MRVADAVGWLAPASLALGVASAASPLTAGAALALGLGASLTFGVAHGALDHELPHRLQQASRSATARIAGAYAAVVGAGFAAFLAAPLPLLAVFLIVSVMHFGTADVTFAQRYAGVRHSKHARLRTLLLGAFPIVVPVVAHPQAALTLLPHLGAAEAFNAHGWLVVRFLLLGAAAVAVIGATVARVRRAGTPGWYRCELAFALAAFSVAPPIVAFLLYFGCWHAARHLLRLAEAYGVDPDATVAPGSLRPLAAFAAQTIPMTSAALGLTGILAALLGRTLPVSLVVVALAFAVTVPHTFAVRFFNRAIHERQQPGSRKSRIIGVGSLRVFRGAGERI